MCELIHAASHRCNIHVIRSGWALNQLLSFAKIKTAALRHGNQQSYAKRLSSSEPLEHGRPELHSTHEKTLPVLNTGNPRVRIIKLSNDGLGDAFVAMMKAADTRPSDHHSLTEAMCS